MDKLRIFTTYLSSGFDKKHLQGLRELCHKQREWDETFLLDRYLEKGAGSYIIDTPQSHFLGRRAWVMPSVPPLAAAGDLWYDTCENVISILIPAESIPWMTEPPLGEFNPFCCWLSVKPVRYWQYKAWRAVKFQESSVLEGNVLIEKPIKGISLPEAKQYALYFNKHIPDHTEWNAVPNFLGETLTNILWQEQETEWSGLKSYVDEDYDLAVTKNSMMLDPDEELENYQCKGGKNPIGETVFSKESVPSFIGFRTAATPSTQRDDPTIREATITKS